jgi:hypothetical protein
MQTLHLRFRDLRAISLRQSLSRWPTPSDATRAGMGAAFALPNPPEPTCAVGSRPAVRALVGIPCPVTGAGMPGVPRLRAARIVGPVGADPCRVCRWQTADVCHQSPAYHEVGEIDGTHRQARASESQRLASDGLSFPLRPQRSGARASGEKTVARRPDGSGTRCSEAPGFCPTGRLKPVPSARATGPAHLPSCVSTPALVTGQEPGGTGVPGVAQRWECARRWQLSSAREEGAWPATTSP